MILPVRSSSPTPVGMRTRAQRAGRKEDQAPRRPCKRRFRHSPQKRSFQTERTRSPMSTADMCPCPSRMPAAARSSLTSSQRPARHSATPGTQPMTRRDQSCPRSINPLRAAQLHLLPLPILGTLPNAHSPSHTHPQHTQHTLQRDL